MQIPFSQDNEDPAPIHVTALDRIRIWHLLFGALLAFFASGSVSASIKDTFAVFESSSVATVTLSVSVAGWFLWALFQQRLNPSSFFGPFPTTLRTWGLITIGCLATYFMAVADLSIIVPFLEQFTPTWFADWYRGSSVQRTIGSPSILQSVLGTVIFASVVEEILFRGLFFQRLARAWSRPLGALLVSSLLFALPHDTPLNSFVFGVSTTLIFMHTRSLWASMAMHASLNGVILAGLNPPKTLLAPLGLGHQEIFGWTCLAISLELIFLLAWVCRSSLSTQLPYIANENAS
jgi:membrane protease YdiL (CAAX protease family)